ncbi:hypothetical protein V8G54_010799 [Vigna mungo]|uniref:Uncharacterized protein n=1 Tax=Vigna mungo TaxID=3915 RepID=A0AAQ3NZJ5_VIGMU
MAKIQGDLQILVLGRNSNRKCVVEKKLVRVKDLSNGRKKFTIRVVVVNSMEWPLISKYRACVRTQSPRKFVRPIKIEKWVVVNFSAGCDVRSLVRISSSAAIEQPFDIFEEDFHNTLFSPLYRVNKMLELLQSKLPGCIVPQKVNDQYLTNVLLKINAKLGGLNSILGAEHSPSVPEFPPSLLAWTCLMAPHIKPIFLQLQR